MTEVQKADSQPVIINNIPQVGDTVWFISDDELTEGMDFEGKVTAVHLNKIDVDVVPYEGADIEVWNLPINDPTFKIFRSYTELLEATIEELGKRLNFYRRTYGIHPGEFPNRGE
jgi:hypothetical protein